MANKKPSGLGRGLGALLGDDVLKPEAAGNLYLPISQVESYSAQPRKLFDEDALSELADSIREHGVIQPLTVRKLSSGYYQIIAGERRWRAARLAGLTEIPAVVIEADDQKAAELALVENLQREDLNPMEEAAGYQSLIQTYHMTQEEAARRVGKSRSAVANAMRLLGLQPGVQGQLSVRQTEVLAKKLLTEPAEEPEIPEPPKEVDYAAEAQRSLASRLGRGVKIVTGRKKGRIELEYYGLDDLNDLLEALALLKTSRKGPEA